MKATILILVVSVIAGAMALLDGKQVNGSVSSNTNPADSYDNATTKNTADLYYESPQGEVQHSNFTVEKTPERPDDQTNFTTQYILPRPVNGSASSKANLTDLLENTTTKDAANLYYDTPAGGVQVVNTTVDKISEKPDDQTNAITKYIVWLREVGESANSNKNRRDSLSEAPARVFAFKFHDTPLKIFNVPNLINRRAL